VLPRRGTVLDLGRSISHKKIICRKSILDRKALPAIAWQTDHSPKAADRYNGDCERVSFCLKKGLSIEETAFTTKMSKSPVMEYIDLIEELYMYNSEVEEMLIKIRKGSIVEGHMALFKFFQAQL